MTVYKSFGMTSWNSLIRLSWDSIIVSCDLKEVVNLIEDCYSTTLVEQNFTFKQINYVTPMANSLNKNQLRMGTCLEK